jgi:hypothetical protein
MEHIWIEIDSAGPADGPGHWIDRDLGEPCLVTQRCEHVSLQHRGEAKLPDDAVGEGQAELTSSKMLDCDDTWRPRHNVRLLKGLDLSERFRYLGALPVCFELVLMKLGPLSDEARRGTWQPATQEGSITDRNQRLVFTVDGVEVRRLMILPVHGQVRC